MYNLPPGWHEPDDGLSMRDMDRLAERAKDRALDDPDLRFPVGGNFDEIELEETECDDGLAWIVRYQGREVMVQLDSQYIIDFLAPDEDDYGDY